MVTPWEGFIARRGRPAMQLPRGPAPLSKLSSLAKHEELGKRGNWTVAALDDVSVRTQ